MPDPTDSSNEQSEEREQFDAAKFADALKVLTDPNRLEKLGAILAGLYPQGRLREQERLILEQQRLIAILKLASASLRFRFALILSVLILISAGVFLFRDQKETVHQLLIGAFAFLGGTGVAASFKPSGEAGKKP